MAPLYVEGSAFLTQPAGRAHRLGTHSLKKLTVPQWLFPDLQAQFRCLLDLL